jgi:hypothetical protein
VLQTKDVTYNGIDYLVLKVSILSADSVAENWCVEYQNLCASYGYAPTGCGQQFTNMNNGYGYCKTQYGSDGTSDSLGCNPSGGVARGRAAGRVRRRERRELVRLPLLRRRDVPEDDVLRPVLQHGAQLHRPDEAARIHALQEVRAPTGA